MVVSEKSHLELLIERTELSRSETEELCRLLLLRHSDARTIGELAERNLIKPMRIARELMVLRQNDLSLKQNVQDAEKLIKIFGTTRITSEAVEGDRRVTDKFWRSYDPLNVYRPGDLFYVDPDHKWMRFFPIWVLAPTLGCVAIIAILKCLFRG